MTLRVPCVGGLGGEEEEGQGHEKKMYGLLIMIRVYRGVRLRNGP